MIKKQQIAKTRPVRLKCQRYTVYYCIAFITLCIICYIYVQTTTLQKKTIEYNSSWTFSQFLKSQPFNNTEVHTPRERKRILLWTKYFTQSNWLPSTQKLNCPVPECDVTSDRSFLNKSSGIIVHWRNVDPEDLPPECPNSRKDSSKNCPILVLFNKEAPPNTDADKIRKLNNRIHLVASYRRDSKIYAPYGKIVRRSEAFKMPELSPNRSTVCWLVSHCQTQSNREVYVNTLKRYIDVDVYGKCGNKSCPHYEPLDCYRWLAKRCKFYLSFENSICKDYSTEKLYYAMMADMVPIVMGGDNFSRYLPSHSFINVADFSSPEVLSRYLKALDKDEASYMAYFKWKEHFKADFTAFEWLCDLCAWLHSATVDDLKPRDDVMSWWYEGSNCGFL